MNCGIFTGDDVPELVQLETAYLEAIEQQRPQCIIDARECLSLESQHRAAVELDWLWQVRKAIMVSPNLAICEALLRGEQVPASKLKPLALQRYARRS